jgi:hypothetical protein
VSAAPALLIASRSDPVPASFVFTTTQLAAEDTPETVTRAVRPQITLTKKFRAPIVILTPKIKSQFQRLTTSIDHPMYVRRLHCRESFVCSADC